MTNPDREELLCYADSLNQQANWIEEALAPETPDSQRIGIEDIDIDELRGASDLLRRLASSDSGVKVKPLVWRDHRPDSFPEPAWSARVLAIHHRGQRGHPMTDRQEMEALAGRLETHVEALANIPMSISLVEWDKVSNDILTASKALRAASVASHHEGAANTIERVIAEAAQLASAHAHHALWGGLLPYGWDDATEQFGRNLADRIAKSIREELPKTLAKHRGIAAAPAVDREEVARIIDAEAFEDERPTWLKRRMSAIAKADRIILSLRATTAGRDAKSDNGEWNEAIEAAAKKADALKQYDPCSEKNYGKAIRSLHRNPNPPSVTTPPGEADTPVAWFYEYNDIHDYWRPGIVLNTPVAKNSPTSHYGKPVRNVRAVYTHPAPSDGAIRDAAQQALKFIESQMHYSQPSYDSGLEPSDQFTYDAGPIVMALQESLSLQPPAEKEG